MGELLSVAEQIVQRDPKSPGGLSLRATAYFGLGKQVEALADAEAALRLNPETAQALLARGSIRNNQGKFAEAIADLTARLRLPPEEVIVYTNRAMSYTRLGEYHQALADASEAIRRTEPTPNYLAMGNRCLVYVYLGEDEKALADVSQVVQLDSDPLRKAAALRCRGLLLRRLKREQEAQADLQEATRLDALIGLKIPWLPMPPVRPRPKELSSAERDTVADLLQQAEKAHQGGINEVPALAAKVLEIDPNHVRALELRADALVILDRPEEAFANAKRAVTLDPSSHMGYGTLAHIYNRRRQWPMGIAYATIALRIKPEDVTAWNNRATAYAALGSYHQALADVNEALKLDRKSRAACLANRAGAYAGLGEYQKALADLNSAIDREPLNPTWYANRSAVYTRLGNMDKAAEDRQQALKLSDGKEPVRTLPEPLPPVHRDLELEPGGPD
jgi:tetratricopeptide (TPR) repeat protein